MVNRVVEMLGANYAWQNFDNAFRGKLHVFVKLTEIREGVLQLFSLLLPLSLSLSDEGSCVYLFPSLLLSLSIFLNIDEDFYLFSCINIKNKKNTAKESSRLRSSSEK